VHIYRARWVVPVTSPPVRDGALGVEDGRITFVGRWRDAPRGDARDLGDALRLPGLINTHTHLELTVMRGLLGELPFARWITTLQRAKTNVLTRESMLDAATLGIAEGLLAGVTTYADTCDSGVALEAMHTMGVRGVMYQEVFGPQPADCDRSLGELRAKLDAQGGRTDGLRRLGVSPHAPYTVSDALFEAVRDLTMERRVPMAVHIAESAEEDALVRDGTGPFAEAHRARGIPVAPRGHSPIALLERLGVMRVKPLLIHCVRARQADIDRIAHADCAIAHCPASNAKLGHGSAPLPEWLAAGIRVGLGSDSMASNDRMHLLEEARLAVFAQRLRVLSHEVISAAQALELPTIGGARALAIDDRVGSLEPGKEADFAAFPLGLAGGLPDTDPIASAIFALGGATARAVAVAGELRVEDGRLLHDTSDLEPRVRSTSDRLRDFLRS
jgi:cytosine/adenosine deaminase-related metal-dependent hydrolase